jgi:hypothetical protein
VVTSPYRQAATVLTSGLSLAAPGVRRAGRQRTHRAAAGPAGLIRPSNSTPARAAWSSIVPCRSHADLTISPVDLDRPVSAWSTSGTAPVRVPRWPAWQ